MSSKITIQISLMAQFQYLSIKTKQGLSQPHMMPLRRIIGSRSMKNYSQSQKRALRLKSRTHASQTLSRLQPWEYPSEQTTRVIGNSSFKRSSPSRLSLPQTIALLTLRLWKRPLWCLMSSNTSQVSASTPKSNSALCQTPSQRRKRRARRRRRERSESFISNFHSIHLT